MLEPCPHCGRTFTAQAFVHHSKACTAEKPLKKKLNRNGEANEEEEKTPLLGLAARQAAAAKQGKFAEPAGKKVKN